MMLEGHTITFLVIRVGHTSTSWFLGIKDTLNWWCDSTNHEMKWNDWLLRGDMI